MNCKGCPHYRPNDINDCIANAHNCDGSCEFEKNLDEFEDFQRWKYPSHTDRGFQVIQMSKYDDMRILKQNINNVEEYLDELISEYEEMKRSN